MLLHRLMVLAVWSVLTFLLLNRQGEKAKATVIKTQEQKNKMEIHARVPLTCAV